MNLNFLKFFFIKDPYESIKINKVDQAALHIIIFSKDRACQLESLLRSIRDHLFYPHISVSIIFKYSSRSFQDGYKMVIDEKILKDITWIVENSFQSDLNNLVFSLKPTDYVMFLVDDDIVFKKIDLAPFIDAFEKRHLFISLRASRFYNKDRELPEFSMTGSILQWQWKVKRKKSNTWNYPFSVDGNIYHVARIQQVIKNISFSAPNSFESAMHDYRKSKWIRKINLAMGPSEPCIFNIPLNRVQTEGHTWNKNIDPRTINDDFLKGYAIDNSKIYSCSPKDTHADVGLRLISNKGNRQIANELSL